MEDILSRFADAISRFDTGDGKENEYIYIESCATRRLSNRNPVLSMSMIGMSNRTSPSLQCFIGPKADLDLDESVLHLLKRTEELVPEIAPEKNKFWTVLLPYYLRDRRGLLLSEHNHIVRIELSK